MNIQKAIKFMALKPEGTKVKAHNSVMEKYGNGIIVKVEYLPNHKNRFFLDGDMLGFVFSNKNTEFKAVTDWSKVKEGARVCIIDPF